MRRLVPLLLVLLLASCSSSTAASKLAPVSPVASLTAVAEDSTATPAARASASPSPATAVAGAEPSGEAALAHVKRLAGEIGPRVAGTPAERAAADYIAAHLREDGFDVELQRFPVKTFASRSVELRITSPDPRSVAVAPLTYSSPGSAQGALVYTGLGRPADYPAGGVAGRIALVQRGEITFGDKVRNAAGAGASAVVVFDPPNDVIPGTITGTIPAIPALTIPGPEGVRLRDALQAGEVTARLAFDGGVEETEATNVIGRPPGHDCAAVVGGHYDTVVTAPGGSDNASGTAAMLELARVQAARGNPQQACFIAFSAEELGLLGSQHFLGALPAEKRSALKYMINFDMVSVGEEWLFIGTPALQRRAQELAAADGVTGRRAELAGASSDHAAFIDRKIPALMLHRSNDSLLHTPQDTAERIAAAPLGEAVRLGLSFLAAFGQD